MTTLLLSLAAIVALTTLPVLALIRLDEWQARRRTLTDAEEHAAAQAIAGNPPVIVYDTTDHTYVQAQRHPSGVVFIERFDEDHMAELLARQAGGV